ncbi:MAG: MgtC/SapB family protein [Intrasporangium sp.]|uniref:MgtC/SapB family protein n=1 Tax=Intrasporangium sp. TaxID=1925024 RepID=UPI0026492BF9|nr:MgtC/SapB family protein [Intrasporangium sp.]MDN5794704.1 MgtC/SapB family protein [Intrasporangium sp.]
MVSGFGEPTGEGWAQVLELGVAFVLALLIGIERESRQKSAGIRTYTLVGLGSALFVLVSKYGFTDVLGDQVRLDPSRVAAGIVTGLGFIGGGLIFVRQDAVRGLTTAASVWLVAAVGAAAGAGLPVLATLTTALYFVIMYALRPLQSFVHGRYPDVHALRVTYVDGRGLLRQIIDLVTSRGFAIEDLTTSQTATVQIGSGRGRDESEAPRQGGRLVTVVLILSGRGRLPSLNAALSEVDGIVAVERTTHHAED